MPEDNGSSLFRTFLEIEDKLVLHVDLSPREGAEECALPWLDEYERARWRRYRFDRPRREFALCRAALRSILCRWLDCKNDQLAFGALEHGKPFALMSGQPAPVSFSVSHSGRHGLIAVATRERLGVDVEDRIPRRNFNGLTETVFGPNEQAEFRLLADHDRSATFYMLWTLKEALIKALGTGFSLNPSGFEVPSAMRRGARRAVFRFPEQPDVDWQLEDLGNEDFAAGFAYEARSSRSAESPASTRNPVRFLAEMFQCSGQIIRVSESIISKQDLALALHVEGSVPCGTLRSAADQEAVKSHMRQSTPDPAATSDAPESRAFLPIYEQWPADGFNRADAAIRARDTGPARP